MKVVLINILTVISVIIFRWGYKAWLSYQLAIFVFFFEQKSMYYINMKSHICVTEAYMH